MRQPKNPAANTDGQQSDAQFRYLAIAGIPVSGIVFLVLTAVTSLLWSSSSLLAGDEYLSLWTDRLPSLAQITHVQRTSPISIDPLIYHVVALTAVRIFGSGPFAIRFPSLIGYLTMQVCLFFFVRRIANRHAAFFALAFPALTSTFFYSVDGRPYGLLLGFFTLAMLSWQAATRCESKRNLWLVTLAVAIALTVNVHYFGLLLFGPLCLAELYRAVRRRRVDIPMLGSIAAGATGIVAILPFLKAARVFSTHYCCYSLKRDAIAEAYLSMFPHFRGSRIESLFDAFLLFATLLLLWACFRQLRHGSILLPEAEAIFILTVALLPFLGYILARHTTNVMEPRYVIGAFPGVTALLAIGIGPVFRRNGIGTTAVVALFLGATLVGVRYIRRAQKDAAEDLRTLNITPEIKAALMASATGKIYFQDAEVFAFASYYEPDAEVRSRLVLVYSRGQELKWDHTDTGTFEVLCMRNFTSFDIEPYESVTGHAGRSVFAVIDDEPRWDWAMEAFEAAHAKVRSVGSAFGVDVVTVQFPPKL